MNMRRYVEGHIVATSPAFSHRLDGVFKDADQYKPERFREPVTDKAGGSFRTRTRPALNLLLLLLLLLLLRASTYAGFIF
jgi:cytochrome P450